MIAVVRGYIGRGFIIKLIIMNEAFKLIKESYPTVVVGMDSETKRIVINKVVHYKQLFRLINHVALIKKYTLEPSNSTTIITLH